MKRVFTNVGLLLAACLLAFGCGELAVRLLFKDDTVLFSRYQTDYTYGKYRLRGIRPNMEFWHTSVDGSWKFTTNARGFRNTRDFSYDKKTGTTRVLSLGDSNTQGYEVGQEQTFSAVLERALVGSGRTAEVINTGVSGFGTAEQLALLENEGVRYRPDAVVVGFFANDFDDNLKSGLFGVDGDGHVVERKFEHLPGVKIQNAIYAIPGVRWLGDNSYFYSMLFNNAWIFAKLQLGRFAAKEASGKPGSEPTEAGGFEYTIPQRVNRYQTDLALGLLERMQQFCVHNGIRLIVVDIPAFPAPYRFVPSLTDPMLERLHASGVEVVTSRSLLSAYEGVAEMHVLHGYHHISAFTHTLIGVEVARRLEAGRTPKATGLMQPPDRPPHDASACGFQEACSAPPALERVNAGNREMSASDTPSGTMWRTLA